MERLPQNNEHELQPGPRPRMEIDFSGPQSIHAIVEYAERILEEEASQAFQQSGDGAEFHAIMQNLAELEGKWLAASLRSTDMTYEGYLAIINEHVRVVDTSESGRYPQYRQEQER